MRTSIIKGFYALEQSAWRWTESRFTVALPTPYRAKQNGAVLTLKFTIPEVSLNKLKSITLSAKAGNLTLAPEKFTTQGHHEYRREIAPSAFTQDLVDVDFSLDNFLGAPESQVELGVIVTFVGLEPK